MTVLGLKVHHIRGPSLIKPFGPHVRLTNDTPPPVLFVKEKGTKGQFETTTLQRSRSLGRSEDFHLLDLPHLDLSQSVCPPPWACRGTKELRGCGAGGCGLRHGGVQRVEISNANLPSSVLAPSSMARSPFLAHSSKARSP